MKKNREEVCMSNNNNKGTQLKILEKYITDLRANRKPIGAKRKSTSLRCNTRNGAIRRCKIQR